VGGSTATLTPGTGSGYTLTINKDDTTNKSWPVTLAITSPTDGSVSYEFVIKDTRANENTQDNLPGADADAHKRISVRVDKQGPTVSVAEPYANQSITNDQLKISGVATDSGVPELVAVYYTVTNGTSSVTAPATRAAAIASPDWKEATPDASWEDTITLDPTVSGQGEKRIHFAAYDQLDNSTTVSRAFYVDFAAPHIQTWTSTDITTPASNLLNKQSFTFSFVAQDSNALKDVKITRNGTALTLGSAQTDGFGSYTITRTAADVPNQNWTYTASFSNQSDGDYVYGIEITDIANKLNLDDNAPVTANNYKTFNVRIDTVGPVLVFNSPDDGSTVSGSTVTIGGTAIDALTFNGVTVWYVIDGNTGITAPAAPPSGDPLVLAGWTRADGSADWYKHAAISNATEGLLYVHAIAYAQLGNKSNLTPKPF
jgi:hypothetical protein